MVLRCNPTNSTRPVGGTNYALATGPGGATGATGATGPAGPGVNAFGEYTGLAGSGRSIECTLGEMMLNTGYTGNGTPAWGQLLQISSYQALFTLIGTGTAVTARTHSRFPICVPSLRTT